jgi:uncharacterized membrane protein
MRMVRRIGLYIGLVLLAALLSAGVAFAAVRMGVSSTVAPLDRAGRVHRVRGGDRLLHGVSALVSAQEEVAS